jgi:hypothetical protein
MQADRPQEQGDRGAKLGIVIDDQHAWIVVRHAESCLGGLQFSTKTPSFYEQSGNMNSDCRLGESPTV